MSVYNHNHYINSKTRNDNSLYTIDFIHKNNLKVRNSQSAFNNISWLRNINRLMEFLDVSSISYNLIDIGCGEGISTLYFRKNWLFKKIIGIDNEFELIKIARENSLTMNSDLTFSLADAKNYLLPWGSNIIFMFNPFELSVLLSFIDNNIINIRLNNNIILYNNDIYINEIKKRYNPQIVRNNFFNLSCIIFK